MARKSKPLRKDRGADPEKVSALKSAAFKANAFLNSGAEDRKKGSFTDAMKALIATRKITADDLPRFTLSRDLFTPLAKGEKVEGLSSGQKRSMTEYALTAVNADLTEYGCRL